MTKKYCILSVIIFLILTYLLFVYHSLKIQSDQEVFTKIYEKNIWGKGSGPGSYHENTQIYRELLQEYFYDERFKTIIDFGCGDFQIMRLINIPDNKIYIGIDIVPEVVKNNIKLYGKKNIRFVNSESESDLKGDLLIVKDVLNHWPNNKIQIFLDKILPNFKYALITHDINYPNLNKDITLGSYRALDIAKLPFNFKNLTIIKEYVCPEKGTKKRVYLYANPKLVESH